MLELFSVVKRARKPSKKCSKCPQGGLLLLPDLRERRTESFGKETSLDGCLRIPSPREHLNRGGF